MARAELKGKLIWLLVVINLISGVLWVLTSLGVGRDQGSINLVYLAVGVVGLVAGGVWFLNRITSAAR